MVVVGYGIVSYFDTWIMGYRNKRGYDKICIPNLFYGLMGYI